MQNIWEQLIDAWRLQSLPIQNPCMEDELDAFETNYKIALPADLREYLQHVNGMSQYWPEAQDEEGFSFWPLNRIKTLAEEMEAKGEASWKLAQQDSFFLFCDYLDWCWAYAIKILPNTGGAEGVYLVCCSAPIKITLSFSDFIRLYLEKSDQLYPPEDHIHR